MFSCSFTINGYDVIVAIEFFLHIVVLEDFSPEPMGNKSESVDVSFDL